MNIAGFSIRRPTLMGAFVVVMLVLGGVSFSRLGVDLMPDIDFPAMYVLTTYRGAGPAEIESMVSKPIEEAVSQVAGVKHINSINQEGVSTVVIEFNIGTDIKDAETQVRSRVALAKAKSLPDGVDEPIYRRINTTDQAILRLSLVTEGLKPADIFDLADRELRPRLEKVDGVSLVEISGGTKREVQVLLDRHKLKSRELSITSVAGHIGANSQNVPVGKVFDESKQMLFRTLGEYRSLDQIRAAAVNFFASDNPISVNDIGIVKDTTSEATSFAFYNGKPAVFLDIYKQSGTNTVAAADGIFKQVEKFNQDMKAAKGSPKVTVVMDTAKIVRANLTDVKESIMFGVILTIVVVYFFLGSGRSTFITIMALPNSMIGAFILMYWQNFTLNVISLMALSLTVGLLVDDAIVVRENIWRHLDQGEDPKTAAIKGTQEVALAVVSTTAVIISVFLPIGLMQGIAGQFFKQLGFTVVFAMMISLFDAMTMAPLLSSYLATAKGETKGKVLGFFDRIFSPLHRLVTAFEKLQERTTLWYQDIIRACLVHRGKVMLAVVLVTLASLGLASKIKFTFMPPQDQGNFMVNIEATPDFSLPGTRDLALKIDAKLHEIKEVNYTALQAGNTSGEANVASIYVELVPYKERRGVTTGMVKDGVRKALASFPVKLKVGDAHGGGGGQSPFTMYIVGDDLAVMDKVARQAKEAFKAIPDFTDLDTSYNPAKPELQVILDPERMKKMGVAGVTAGMELRGLIDGTVPAQFRDGDYDYDIRVMLKDEQKDLREGLDKFWVPNMNFNLVQLSSVADPKAALGPTKINRRDRQRYILVSAELTPEGALGAGQKKADAIMKKMAMPEGVQYLFAGQSEYMADMANSMVLAMALALLFIYLVLASLYESIVMPLLIMLALPFAIVGALIALFITGKTLDMFSMIGIVLLMGLVAKNSILLVDYANQLIRKGWKRHEALVEAGRIRLRPILMTTVALIAGMLPLALALSEVSRFRQSMGIAVIGGLVVSTLLTLIVIPACYEWFDDFRLWSRGKMGRPALREIDQEEEATK